MNPKDLDFCPHLSHNVEPFFTNFECPEGQVSTHSEQKENYNRKLFLALDLFAYINPYNRVHQLKIKILYFKNVILIMEKVFKYNKSNYHKLVLISKLRL